MAGCIFSSPSEGKGLVVANIFFGLLELRLNHVARVFRKFPCCTVSVVLAWLTGVSQRNILLTEKSLCNAVICVFLCTYVYLYVHGKQIETNNIDVNVTYSNFKCHTTDFNLCEILIHNIRVLSIMSLHDISWTYFNKAICTFALKLGWAMSGN